MRDPRIPPGTTLTALCSGDRLMGIYCRANGQLVTGLIPTDLMRDSPYLQVLCANNCHCVNVAPQVPEQPQRDPRPQVSDTEHDNMDISGSESSSEFEADCSESFGHPNFQDCNAALDELLDTFPPAGREPNDIYEFLGIDATPQWPELPKIQTPQFQTHRKPLI